MNIDTLPSKKTYANIINPEYELSTFTLSQTQVKTFQQNGYTIFANVFQPSFVQDLNTRLEYVLRGVYDRNVEPDKVPKKLNMPLPNVLEGDDEEIVEKNDTFCNHNHSNEDDDRISNTSCCYRGEEEEDSITIVTATTTKTKKSKMKQIILPLGYNLPKQNKNKSSQKQNQNQNHHQSNHPKTKVLQIINIHKSDSLFHTLVSTPLLGYIVSHLMSWPKGARLVQDQIWAKPPLSPPLTYHRDSPYFMFNPNDVCTVWITFDDLDTEEIGPLVYVKHSHLWKDGRVGSARNFFQKGRGNGSSSIGDGSGSGVGGGGGMALLYSAAEREGVKINELEFFSTLGLKRGSISVHNGRTWHGSGENKTLNRPRRGMGLHFVPVDVKWTRDAIKSKIWRKYVEDVVESGGDVGEIVVDEKDFPIVYSR